MKPGTVISYTPRPTHHSAKSLDSQILEVSIYFDTGAVQKFQMFCDDFWAFTPRNAQEALMRCQGKIGPPFRAPRMRMSPQATTETATTTVVCAHSWKSYVGFTQVYDFCTKCDEKRGTDAKA